MKLSKELLKEAMIYTDVEYEEEMDKACVEELVKDLLSAIDKLNEYIDDLQEERNAREEDIKYNYRRIGGYEY